MMKNFIEDVLILFSVFFSVTGAGEVIYAQVGDTVTLKTTEYNQQKYHYWYFNNHDNKLRLAWLNPLGGKVLLQDKNWKISLSGNSLIIKDIRDEQFGTFLWEHNSGNSLNLKVTTYTVLKLRVMKPNSVVLPGESVSLGCFVDAPPGQVKPDVHWLDPRGVRVKNNRGTLDKKAESQDSGKWTCVVGTKNTAHISVSVVDLAPSPENLYSSTSSRLTVPCSLPSWISWDHLKQKGIQEVQWHFSPKTSSSPASDQRLWLLHPSPGSSFTWKKDKDRDLVPVSDATKRNLSLSRDTARVEDRGDFTCSMAFQNGSTLSRTVHVEVLQLASFIGTEFTSGQTLNLSCSTGEPLTSDMQLKWFPPDQSSLLKSDRHGAHLAIKEASTGDGGKWRCELWRRDLLLASAELKLTIEPKLSVWMLAIICSAIVILILLVILTFILCRRKQHKTRNHRHRLCQCKNPKPKGFYRT